MEVQTHFFEVSTRCPNKLPWTEFGVRALDGIESNFELLSSKREDWRFQLHELLMRQSSGQEHLKVEGRSKIPAANDCLVLVVLGCVLQVSRQPPSPEKRRAIFSPHFQDGGVPASLQFMRVQLR